MKIFDYASLCGPVRGLHRNDYWPPLKSEGAGRESHPLPSLPARMTLRRVHLDKSGKDLCGATWEVQEGKRLYVFIWKSNSWSGCVGNLTIYEEVKAHFFWAQSDLEAREKKRYGSID